MTTERRSAQACVKIRPAGPLWIAFFVVGAACLWPGVDELRNGRPWFALLWLAPGCVSIAVALVLRVFGVDLTPEFAVVRNLRPRRVPWREVQAVIAQEGEGYATVLLTFERAEPLILEYPGPVGHKGKTQCERDFQRIHQWWLAHRGESWRPVDPEAPEPT